MTSHEILRADLLDILFDKRNKDYGAYTLRKFYNNRLAVALGLALGAALLLILVGRLGGSREAVQAADREGVIIRTYEIPPVKEKIEPPRPPKAQPATTKAVAQANLTTQIKMTNTTTIADQDALKQAAVSNITVSGPPDIFHTPTPPADPAPAAAPAAPEPPAEALIQREPEFPGGAKAWRDFLARNLQSPSSLEYGERKTVMIRFLVSQEGAVTGFEILQSAGSDYDGEVIRVLRRMPRWKPALVNSQPVARSFTQPVTFVGIEN